MSLREIVNVTITRETKAVSKPGFGTAMILGTHKRFTGRIKYYSDASSMLIANGGDFQSTDKEYIAAVPMFSQPNAPLRVAVGRRATPDTAVITVSTVENTTVYTVTINGTAFTFVSDASATDIEIAAGLVAAINLGSEPVTATDNADGTFDIDPDVAGVAYSLTVDSNLTVTAYTASDTMANDLAAIKNVNNDWYGLILTSRVLQDQLDAAAWVESNKKVAKFSSNSSDIINTTDASDTTTLAAQLKASSYERSQAFYHPDADTIYPESAIFGVILPKNPGSYTEKFKTLSGIAVTSLTDTQSKNARDKNCMVYEEIGGVNIMREGKSASGEFFDIIVFVDWLEAEIMTNVYGNLVNQDKVPYTDPGAASIEGNIKTALDLGVERGGLAADPAPTTSVPLVANVSTQDKANRLLPDVTFTGTLAGAIHSTTINGRVIL